MSFLKGMSVSFRCVTFSSLACISQLMVVDVETDSASASNGFDSSEDAPRHNANFLNGCTDMCIDVEYAFDDAMSDVSHHCKGDGSSRARNGPASLQVFGHGQGRWCNVPLVGHVRTDAALWRKSWEICACSLTFQVLVLLKVLCL